MQFRKPRCLAAALLLALTPLACAAPAAKTAPEASAGPVELSVFAAASMTDTMTKIAELYRAVAPNVAIVYTFDSSGTLKTQIEAGAICDVFISAAQKQMNALDASRDAGDNPDGLDFVEQGTRVDLLENRVALVVPEGNPKGITGFDQLAALLESGGVFMAMGNSDVPVGQYTQKILAYYGLDEQALAEAGALTYGGNVKEVATQVAEGSVDCGVVYGTDACSASLTAVDYATADMCGRVVYPAAVLNVSAHKHEARAFLAYLQTPEAAAVFRAAGFSPLS